ncbi:MAG: hypothetical protein ACTSR2_04460 [Candidatus Hodarchaeales archaeon]
MSFDKTIEFNDLFLEFFACLIQLDYGEEPNGFIQGVLQKVFSDE